MINYLHEHLWPGIAGQAFILISFIVILISTIFFFGSHHRMGINKKRLQWARIFYFIHLITIVLSVVLLYYIIFNHYFEYKYAYSYSSSSMKLKYLISSLWAGQEGSYLLWALLQAIIGLFVVKRMHDYEPYVMGVFGVSQSVLLSLLFGYSVGSVKVGSTPFVLLRNATEYADDPFFQYPNYLELPPLADGTGMNPLLENPWMIIHPPVLFLGYAIALVPFGIAFSALIRNKISEWYSIALPYVIATLIVLGAGILLGGAWAYVSLSFGGFWAWDPVENASLVPWLIAIIALHFILLGKAKKQGPVKALIPTMLVYITVIFASFLTRSGILGESSVHAFGGNPNAWQLTFFVLLFSLVPLVLFIVKADRQRLILKKRVAEEVLSREFFLLLGVIFVILAALHIFLTTSLPVINVIFNTEFAPPAEPEKYYVKWQLPYAILITLLMGVSQVFVYGKNNLHTTVKILLWSLGITMVIFVLWILFGQPFVILHFVMFFVLLFLITSSIVLIVIKKVAISNAGSYISHLGFGLFLLGVLITFTGKSIISKPDIHEQQHQMGREGYVMMLRGEERDIGAYTAVYQGILQDHDKRFYKIDFFTSRSNGKNYSFSLYPSIKLNERFGRVYEPATKTFIHKDIFVYINTAGVVEKEDYNKEYLLDYISLQPGDSIKTILSTIYYDDYQTGDHDTTKLFFTRVHNQDRSGIRYDTIKMSVLNDSVVKAPPLVLFDEEIRFVFRNFDREHGTLLTEALQRQQDFIIVKAIVFPWISLLWFGVFVMMAGFIIAFIKRNKIKKNND
ncbi:MAG: cytochrome c biogenesis protein CcsA [Bacteroidales bacterium]|nr:cytochrome c biogenesis protein CcsA [Bacteroidales bacterium]